MIRLHTIPPTEQVYRSHVPPKYDGFLIEKYFAARFSYQDEEEWSRQILAGKIKVNGTIVFSTPPPFIKLPSTDIERDWGVRWPFLDTDYYAAQHDAKVLPFFIRQSPEDPNSFIRQWPAFNAKYFMHIGYAIQWFVFAVITILVYLGFLPRVGFLIILLLLYYN